MAKLTAGVLCGGRGERLWPLSQKIKPKQLLKLIGNQSSLQRVINSLNKNEIEVSIIGNKIHRSEALQQIYSNRLKFSEAFWEDKGKNTAFAIAVMAHRSYQKNGEEAVLAIIPSDQYWGEDNTIADGVNEIAKYVAKNDCIACIGISPQFPCSEYGYIFINSDDKSKSDVVNDIVNISNNAKRSKICKIDKFCEKPSLENAEQYIKTGDCTWNSGIYCARAKVFLEEIKKFAPSIYFEAENQLNNAKHSQQTGEFFMNNSESAGNSQLSYPSIDKAVIEKCQDKIVCLNLGEVIWEDIGSFAGLVRATKRHTEKVKNITMLDACNSYAYTNDKPVYILGTDDLIVLNLADRIIVMNQKYANEIKQKKGLVGGETIFEVIENNDDI